MLYEDVKLTCMVATIPVEEESDLVGALKAELDPTCLLPADASNPFPRMVVACLDINQVSTCYSSPPSTQIRFHHAYPCAVPCSAVHCSAVVHFYYLSVAAACQPLGIAMLNGLSMCCIYG